MRRLIRALADSYDLNLSGDVVEALSRDRGGGCLSGCLVQVVLYPLKRIFRKIFYFLEWKRAVDLTSYTYYYGYLVDYALSAGVIGPLSNRSASEVREAIDLVCREAPTKPVESVVSVVYKQSRNVLISAAGAAERAYGRMSGRPDGETVARATESVEEEERREVAGVIDRIQRMIEDIPEAHFRDLRERLMARLDRGVRDQGNGVA